MKGVTKMIVALVAGGIFLTACVAAWYFCGVTEEIVESFDEPRIDNVLDSSQESEEMKRRFAEMMEGPRTLG